MNIFAFNAHRGNFGDDLNRFLWPALFGELIAQRPAEHLIGIGSILDQRLDALSGTKVIFGTGVRSLGKLPAKRDELDVYFVRGPISALALGSPTRWITDPAILAGALLKEVPASRKGVGFMPHYRTAEIVDWVPVCKALGLQYINPSAPALETLNQIAGCDRVITEAMHGAIIADTFRIPWTRVCIFSWRIEGFDVSSLKWLDWGLSIGADISPHFFGPLPVKPKERWLRPVYMIEKHLIQNRVERELKAFTRSPQYRLSPDGRFEEAMRSIRTEVDRLRDRLAALHAQ